MKWEVVCPYGRLETERGVAALVERTTQVALFRLHDGTVYAIGNVDPLTGAAVLARGIVGTRGDAPTVASPLHKEVYDLRTGECLDQPEVAVPVYPVRIRDGLVEIGLSAGLPARDMRPPAHDVAALVAGGIAAAFDGRGR